MKVAEHNFFFWIFLSRKKNPKKIQIFYIVKMEKIIQKDIQKKNLKKYPDFYLDLFFLNGRTFYLF